MILNCGFFSFAAADADAEAEAVALTLADIDDDMMRKLIGEVGVLGPAFYT